MVLSSLSRLPFEIGLAALHESQFRFALCQSGDRVVSVLWQKGE